MAKVPEGPTVVGEIRWVSGQILPADTVRLLLSSLQERNPHPGRLIVSGLSLSVFAGLGLMLTLMEGFRRAYRLPRSEWGFWERRLRALFLVLIVLVPLALATLLLVFGRAIELWMVLKAGHELRHLVLLLWRMARWTLALITSLTVLGALYHFGTRRREHWLHVLPGAVAASAVWFPATLGFRLVCYPHRRLHHLLRIFRCGDRYAGVALPHVVQRAAGGRTQRSSLPRAQQRFY